MQAHDVGCRKEGVSVIRNALPIGYGPSASFFRGPPLNPEAKRLGIARDGLGDAPISVKAQRLTAQGPSDPKLPLSGFEALRLLRDLPITRHDERQRQFCCGVGRRVAVHVRAEHHTVPGAGRDINMRVDAALADEFQLRKSVQKILGDRCPFPEQNKALGLCHPISKAGRVGFVIGPDRDVMPGKLFETGQATQRVEPVVKNVNLHRLSIPDIMEGVRGVGTKTGLSSAPRAAETFCRSASKWLNCASQPEIGVG